jgi:hypothetical protein
MLEQLRKLTSSDDYLKDGGLRIKEVLIRPWEEKEMKIILEILMDFPTSQLPEKQTWEIVCQDIMYNTSNRIQEPKIPHTQIKVLTEHPALWNYSRSIYFSVNGTCDNIPELMGDLFIGHDKVCGNWVDFQWLYSGLPETLATQRENQLAVPEQLSDSCFKVFKKHNIKYVVNEIEKGDKDLLMLLFSNPDIWPDNYCFGQPYLIARNFGEKRLD